MSRPNIFQLFIIFLKIGGFTFGGGYAMVPLIQKELVENRGWLQEDEFLEILAICQTAPGAIAINLGVFVGFRLHGVFGAVVAASGFILPSFFIILALATVITGAYDHPMMGRIFAGIRPAVAALVAAAAIGLMKKGIRSRLQMGIAGLALALLVLGWHPAWIMVCMGMLGMVHAKGGQA